MIKGVIYSLQSYMNCMKNNLGDFNLALFNNIFNIF